MNRPRAWMTQAEADLALAQRLYRLPRHPVTWCQIAAKCQQSVEKSMKAVIDKLYVAGLTGTQLDSQHAVARYVSALTRFPSSGGTKGVPQRLAWMLSGARRAVIIELDELAPKWPSAGALARRNTEYPYQLSAIDWSPPAETTTFTIGEIRRWVTTCPPVVGNLRKALDALDLAYP